MKILLDTDIGCDIDDCFALSYLLSHENAELLGITTTTGRPEIRAQLADVVCSALGASVPIHVGFEQPLSGKPRQPLLTDNQTAVAERCLRRYANEITAIEFMRRTIEANPHEVTLICIGPLTNAAVLFSLYPHIHELLVGMVIMGGRYTDNEYCDLAKWGVMEWNCVCDPLAASIVFSRKVQNCVVIGVEQTCRFSLDPAETKAAFGAVERLKPIADAVDRNDVRVWFHDVLAMYAFFHPDEVEWQCGDITVDPFAPERPAETHFVPSETGRHHLVTDFSLAKFKQHYCDVVGVTF